MGSIPESGRSPRGRWGNPLQYSCLENPMDRGAWRAPVHGITASQTRLKQLSTAHTRAGVLRDAICIPAFEEGMNSEQIQPANPKANRLDGSGWRYVSLEDLDKLRRRGRYALHQNKRNSKSIVMVIWRAMNQLFRNANSSVFQKES